MPKCRNMTLCWVIYALWSTIGVIWVISHTLTPSAAWAWSGAMIISPPAATLLLFLTRKRVIPQHETTPRPSYTRLQNTIANGCGSVLTMHNDVRSLHDATRTYTALIRDLQHAQREINIQYYILSNDHIAKTIFDILARRARAGVTVRIIYDSIGSWQLKRSHIEALRRSGVGIRAYGTISFPYIRPCIHRRNHRKLVIIDGNIIYLGGINIANRYIDGGRLGRWRDEHIRIEGVAARQAQTMFLADWMKSGGKQYQPHRPVQYARHTCPVQLAWAECGATRDTLSYTILEAIASARHNIRIATPYFLPTPEILTAICSAARSGVKVELLIPLKTDVKIIGAASEGFVRHCVMRGVKVYRYRSGFLHSKTITIDNSTLIVGSANIDYRSLRYNLELSAVIYNKEVAADYIARFYADVANSECVDANNYREPSAWQLFTQGAARLLAPIL